MPPRPGYLDVGDKRYCWNCWRNSHKKVKARKDAFGRPLGECELCAAAEARKRLAEMPSMLEEINAE